MNNTMNQHLSYESYFDGGLADYIGYSIVAWAIAFFTLGICTPWSICIMQSWKAKHTIINGHRLQFTGSAIGLFGHWIKWFFLTIINIRHLLLLAQYQNATMDYQKYPFC